MNSLPRSPTGLPPAPAIGSGAGLSIGLALMVVHLVGLPLTGTR